MHVRGLGEAAGKQRPAHAKVMGVRASLPLYVMLGLTTALFGVQLALSHVTHALTLLVDSYHMLCNLIALTGCIITIKKGLGGESSPVRSGGGSNPSPEDSTTEISTLQGSAAARSGRSGSSGSAADRRLRNTFGWARIDVLVSLIGCVFLASLCFSLLVEAVQTLLHIDHHDEMHEPLYVAGCGVASLVVNVLCYVLIGGYTFHQGSFFHVTENGDVVLEPAVTQDSVKMGERRLSAQRRVPPRTRTHFRQRQGFREMLRDTVGCVLVIVTALAVFFTDQSVGKYADPLMSIVSAVLLLVLSYPYMKEAGLILLQTIPEHININQLRSDFMAAFPDVENIHDLHVWRLNQARVFCTAHVRYRNARDYLRTNQDVSRFFAEYGVTQVTVQPEFRGDGDAQGGADEAMLCLMRCPGESCLRAHCCAPPPSSATPAAPATPPHQASHYLRIASDLSLPALPCDAHEHHKEHHKEHHGHGDGKDRNGVARTTPSTSPARGTRVTSSGQPATAAERTHEPTASSGSGVAPSPSPQQDVDAGVAVVVTAASSSSSSSRSEGSSSESVVDTAPTADDTKKEQD